MKKMMRQVRNEGIVAGVILFLCSFLEIEKTFKFAFLFGAILMLWLVVFAIFCIYLDGKTRIVVCKNPK